MINVDFQHWRYIISENDLMAYGSPHYSRSMAGKALRNKLDLTAHRITSLSLKFNELQILCGNEAFPEAAIADPLADLEVWDEWKTGFRSFPYPGRYSRFNIVAQEAKTNSTSSIGVIGEIMTGLFAQAGINPWVLVRVIRKWPDFIFYCNDTSTYAFVESKAFTRKDNSGAGLDKRVPETLLKDCLVDALQQINADPFIVVWGAFTEIVEINPMRYKVTFLEICPDHNRKKLVSTRRIPDAVRDGISEQAVSIAISLADRETLHALTVDGKKSKRREQAERKIEHLAQEHIESILIEAAPEIAIMSSREDIDRLISQIVSKIKISEDEDMDGKRLRNALFEQNKDFSNEVEDIRAKEDEYGRNILRPQDSRHLKRIRKIGESDVVVRQLYDRERQHITASYKPNWENACKVFTNEDGIDIYRCGGILIGIE